MSGFSCDNCADTGSLIVVTTDHEGHARTSEESCQECCEHDYDSSEGMQCINCGAEYEY